MLTFVEETHTYYWNGDRVPNVTRIIGPLTDYSAIAPDVLKRAQDQGIAIHKMVELDCKGELDVAGLPEWLRGRYKAWCRFKEETGFECIQSEHRMYHEKLGYAGTADLFGLMPNLPRIRGVANLDVKRSLYAGPAIGLQTAGYSDPWNCKAPKDMKVRHRGALVLADSGSYNLTFYSDPEDWTAFLACLQQLRWKEKHYGRS